MEIPDYKTKLAEAAKYELLARTVDCDHAKVMEVLANIQSASIPHEICRGSNPKNWWKLFADNSMHNELISSAIFWRTKYFRDDDEYIDVVSNIADCIGQTRMDHSVIPKEYLEDFSTVEDVRKILDGNCWLVFIYYIMMASPTSEAMMINPTNEVMRARPINEDARMEESWM